MKRSEVGAARIGDRIYVVGGYKAPGGATTGALESYDISSGSWTRRRSLPIAVNHPAVTSAGGRLYVNGGFQAAGQQQASARLYRYAPETNRWRRLPDSPIARAAHALQPIRGKLYAAGAGLTAPAARSAICSSTTSRAAHGGADPGCGWGETTSPVPC